MFGMVDSENSWQLDAAGYIAIIIRNRR